jgi:hypothetical protein
MSAIVPASALAQGSSEEAQGQAILRSVQDGDRSCSQLTDSDFELAGEAWMEQTLGSAQAHDAMNDLMNSMMGSSGEERMHEYMGRRATGCGGGTVPSGFGRMMNMMGLVGGAGGSAGMMGGIGSMMGGSSSSSQENDDNDVSGWAVGATVALMALFLAGAYFVLRGARGRRAAIDPVEILQRRLAAGEINQADYDRRLELLRGRS